MACERCGGDAVERACGLCAFLVAEEALHRGAAIEAIARAGAQARLGDDAVGFVSAYHRARAEMFRWRAEACAARADGIRAQLEQRGRLRRKSEAA